MRELVVECSYEPCNCTVTATVAGAESYCGDFCSSADGSLESDYCSCGHPPCDEP